MKHVYWFFLMGVWPLFAQEAVQTAVTTSLTTVLVTDVSGVRATIDTFIQNNKINPIDYYIKKLEFGVTLRLTDKQYKIISTMVKKMGYIENQKTALVDYSNQIQLLENEIAYLAHQHEQSKGEGGGTDL